MTDIIRHRGPDSEGFHVEPGIGLGVRRLSIIDLQTGDQPIANEDGTVTVVCNGEIYNSPELREELLQRGHRFRTRSDIEVIVHLYEDHGAECVHRLRGMFGFALWDAKKRRLMLARDRLGIKPLHYAIGKDASFYFGSEQKSILIADSIERQIDVQALLDLFTFGFITSSKTLFTQIRRLLPGHYLLYQGGHLSTHRYWDLCYPDRDQEEARMTADEWAEALLEKLEESVRIHLNSDVPVGAWLSAGIDSSGIVSLMARIAKRPIQTFSLAFDDHPSLDEVTGQKTLSAFPEYNLVDHRIVCKREHFNLFPKTLWHLEDPNTSGAQISRMILSQAASRHFKVVLTGEGSDELFGGYPWYWVDKVLRPFAKLPLALRRLMLLGPLMPRWKPWASQIFLAPWPMSLARYARLIGLVHGEVLERLFSGDIKQALKDAGDPSPALIDPNQLNRWHPFTQLQYVEAKTRLADHTIYGLDRTSMAYSLEARVPFLDHELVELCARIPPSLKMRGLKEKYILRRAMEDRLPSEIVRRRKRGLVGPTEAWLREELPEFAAELLSEKDLRKKGYFNPDVVSDLLAQHRAGKTNYARPLMAVLGVQMWDELFIQGCRPATISEPEVLRPAITPQ